MVPRGSVVLWAVFMCLSCSTATWPAFLVQVRTRGQHVGTGTVASHGIQYRAGRKADTQLFSVTEKADATQELSDLDARVLDELLKDPQLLESLVEQRVQLEGNAGDDDGYEGAKNITDVENKHSTERGLAVGGEMARGGKRSVYESVTMQVVEELQDSARGFFAKISAAFESAGIYISNRAQVDTKIARAAVDYASSQAAAGTSRLLLTATSAASPALLLMGVNTTETQAALNDSLQLLSMGIVPDSVGVSPKLLPSFKDFDDDGKRLDAAYQRQRRRRSKPLSVKILGALPSTLNKAADLAYEVEQEVKYERAGNRANKLLKPVGLSLPEAKGSGLLLERGSDPVEPKFLEAPSADDSPIATNMLPASTAESDIVESMPEVGVSTTARGDPLKEAVMKQEPTPPAPENFDVLNFFRRKFGSPEGDRVSPGAEAKADGVQSKVELKLAAALTSESYASISEVTTCLAAVDSEVLTQESSLQASNAVLCSSEPVIAGLEESSKRDMFLLKELKTVASNVQQVYVLAEMADAVEAAEVHLRRLEELSANAVDLSAALRTYTAKANVRLDRLVVLRAKLRRLLDLGDVADMKRLIERDSSYGSQELQLSFDGEKNACHRDRRAVGELLGVVWRESADRDKDDATKLYEDALAAACRLWEACAVESTSEPANVIESTTQELTVVENVVASTAPTPKARGAFFTAKPRDKKRRGVTEIAEAEREALGAETEYARIEMNEQASTTENSDQRERAAQMDGGITTSPTSIDGDAQVQDSPIGAAPTISQPEIAPVAFAPEATVEDKKVGVDREKVSEVSKINVGAVDANIVSDATVIRGSVASSLNTRNMRQASEEEMPRSGSSPSGTSASHESSIEVVVDDTSPFVDAEAEIEDISDQTKVGLKVLDVFALLLEKVLFVGLPMVLSGGALVWERVDNAMNGAEGRKGWKLLSKLKHDPGGNDESRE